MQSSNGDCYSSRPTSQLSVFHWGRIQVTTARLFPHASSLYDTIPCIVDPAASPHSVNTDTVPLPGFVPFCWQSPLLPWHVPFSLHVSSPPQPWFRLFHYLPVPYPLLMHPGPGSSHFANTTPKSRPSPIFVPSCWSTVPRCAVSSIPGDFSYTVRMQWGQVVALACF